MKRLARVLASLLCLLSCACSPSISLLGETNKSLTETTVSGKGVSKIALIQVRGTISSQPEHGLLSTRASLVREVAARLQKAAEDERVKGVVLLVDSPGGTVTDSDILYHEVQRLKAERGWSVVALIGTVGASGGYYVSLAADAILAHPTSITGSIGTIFIRPELRGLMDKLGVDAAVTKSGRLKDMGSPFRPATGEEKALFEDMITQLNGRFLSVVRKRRPGLDAAQLARAAEARVYAAPAALEAGLIDGLGYREDAVERAKALAGLSEAKVVSYGRHRLKNPSLYGIGAESEAQAAKLVDLGPLESLAGLPVGFAWLWTPGLGE